MVYYLIVTLYILVCLLLGLVILLQQGKGGDIASAFGGGSSQTAFGARAGATVLTRATSILAGLFMVGALMLAIYGQGGPGSVVGGTKAPVAPTAPASSPAPAQPPAGQPPAATPPAGTQPPAAGTTTPPAGTGSAAPAPPAKDQVEQPKQAPPAAPAPKDAPPPTPKKPGL